MHQWRAFKDARHFQDFGCCEYPSHPPFINQPSFFHNCLRTRTKTSIKMEEICHGIYVYYSKHCMVSMFLSFELSHGINVSFIRISWLFQHHLLFDERGRCVYPAMEFLNDVRVRQTDLEKSHQKSSLEYTQLAAGVFGNLPGLGSIN